MPLLARKTVILAKIETTYGTDPVPTGGANAIEVRNPQVTPMAGNTVERDVVRSYMGNFESIPANVNVACQFECYLAGAGAAGSVPGFGPLLRACGLAEVVTASTKVEYQPISSAFESVTIYFNQDGLLHKLTGARGTFQINLDAQGLPYMQFNFTGIWNAPSDTALPTPIYTSFQQGVVANNTNTTAFSLFSYTGILQSFSYNHAGTAEPRMLIGSESVLLTDRRPAGEILIEAPAIATKDFFSIAKAGTSGVFAIQHGQTAGKIVTIDMPKLILGQPSYEVSQGVQMLRLPYAALPSSGNDEFKLTVK